MTQQLVKESAEGFVNPCGYSLRVQYDMPPLSRLYAYVGKYRVSDMGDLFDGRPWRRHSSCVTIDEKPGSQQMYLAKPPTAEFISPSSGGEICYRRDGLATYYASMGMRFAIETELMAFAHVHSEPMAHNTILALGSAAHGNGGRQYVAALTCFHRPTLEGRFVAYQLLASDLLLLVPSKASHAL